MADLAAQFRLTGRIAVITGAGKGMGAATAIAFAEAGAVYLASPAASFVTGKLLAVNGAASGGLLPHNLPDLEPDGLASST